MFLKNILSVLAFALLIDAAPVKRSPGFVTLDFNVKRSLVDPDDPTVEAKRSPLFLEFAPSEFPVGETGRDGDVDKRGPVAVTLHNEAITYTADITVGSDNQNLMLLLTLGLLTCGFQIQTLFVFQNGVVTKETSVRVPVLIPQHLPALPKI